jgi:hypothetical protein
MTEGRHRHPATLRLITMISLPVALVATVVTLALKPPVPAVRALSPQPAEVTLAQAYPQVKPVAVGGAEYTPLFFMDENRSIGTSDAQDGSVLLLAKGPGRQQRELRRLPKSASPEFAGFVADGERLVWLELTIAAQGVTESRLWTIDSAQATPRMIIADMGDVALFDKRDDLVLHGGEVSWVAAGQTDTPQTEIRTVALGGGKVRVTRLDGAFSFAGWPWIASVNLGQNAPIELRNLTTGEKVMVPVQPNELMACSPAWCRSVVIGSGAASTVIELQKPDGSRRFRAASGSVAASIMDVGLLDRFEIYSYSGGRLVLYDIEGKRAIVLEKGGASQVASRGAVLWWSTGDSEAISWKALNLRALITP